MTEIVKLMERQASRQKDRKNLSWPDKIRMAERVRPSVARWSSRAGRSAPEARASGGAGHRLTVRPMPGTGG